MYVRVCHCNRINIVDESLKKLLDEPLSRVFVSDDVKLEIVTLIESNIREIISEMKKLDELKEYVNPTSIRGTVKFNINA